jgi:6-pyruvoyltetrahydropterin/6-carboxytetrahydropterin synthase
MYSLGVGREFNARHYLVGADFGDENTEHQHRYRLEVVLEAEDLNRHGFLVDIVEVETHLDAVVAGVRDQILNTLAPFSGLNPSIERLAFIIHQTLRGRLLGAGLTALTVTIREDDIAWTSYRESL